MKIKGAKILVYASCISLGAVFASCQNDTEKEFINEDSKSAPEFNLVINETQDARTIIDGTSVSWAEGDVISILYGSDATPVPFTVNIQENGSAIATTDNTELSWEKGNTFYAIYPYSEDMADAHSVAIEMPATFEQTDAIATNIGSCDVMVAEPIVWTDQEPTLKFQHAVAFINFELINDSNNDMTFTGVELSTAESVIPTAGTIDITLSSASDEFAKIVPTSYTNNISVTTTGSWATLTPGESVNLKVAIIPTDMSEQVITVTFKTSAGDTKIETYGKEFKAGVIYGFNKSIGWDGSSQEVKDLSVFKFTALNNEGLYQDIVFKKQKDNTYSATVVPEVDLSQIIPTFDYTGKVTIGGKVIESDKTAVNFSNETLVRFDNKKVVFKVNREYAIPVVRVNTLDGSEVDSKDYYWDCHIEIDGKNMYEDYSTVTEADSIRGRGNSTWSWYPKKPYRIKLDKKAALLGMGEGKSFVLLANYRDPTNFMNSTAFDMARYMGMPYTNSVRFVELYLNDDYKGLYMMTEQIQQGKGRVDVEKEGGYLLSLDADDGPNLSPNATDNFLSEVFRVNYSGSNIPVCVKHPEDINEFQLDDIRTDFGNLERIIERANYEKFKQVMNVESYMAFFIIQEMTRNVELSAPRSMYIHKHADGMWAMGPVWDFDGGYAYDWGENHGYFGSQSWLCGENPGQKIDGGTDFFDRMFYSAEFTADFKKFWNANAQGMYNYAMAQLDDYYKHTKAAMQRDAERWPISKSYSTEINRLKSWLRERIEKYQSVVDKM